MSITSEKNFYITDVMANFFRNMSYGNEIDTEIIRSRLEILLEHQIVNNNLLLLMLELAININGTSSNYIVPGIRRNCFHFNGELQNFFCNMSFRNVLYDIDYSSSNLNINETLIEYLIRNDIEHNNVDNKRGNYIEFNSNNGWGFTQKSKLVINTLFKVKFVPRELKQYLSNPEISQIVLETYNFIQGVILILTNRKKLNTHIDITIDEINNANNIQFQTEIEKNREKIRLRTGHNITGRLLDTFAELSLLNERELILKLEQSHISNIRTKIGSIPDSNLLIRNNEIKEQLININREIKRIQIIILENEIAQEREREQVRQERIERNRQRQERIERNRNSQRIEETDLKFKLATLENCSNKETPINWEDINDNTNILISYESTCYTIDELTEGFKPFGELNNFYSYRIFKDGEFIELKVEDALQLFELATQLIPNFTDNSEKLESIQNLLTAIQNVKDAVKGNTTYEIDTYKIFDSFEPDVKNAIRDYLKEFFYTGMYMRRWKGIGFPLPLSTKSTKSEIFSPERNVAPHLDNLVDLLNNIRLLSNKAGDFVESLKQVQHYTGIENVSILEKNNIKKLFDITNSGNYCIRMGSTYFIGSGAFYLKLFYNFIPEGYDINLLQQIH